MDDIGAVMTPFGVVVTVILVVNTTSYEARGNDKNWFLRRPPSMALRVVKINIDMLFSF